MSEFKRFMKQNKIVKGEVSFRATSSLIGEDNKPLEWVLKPLSTKENDYIRDECTVEVPSKNNSSVLVPKLDTSKYIAKMICACVVSPNLFDKDLQDSYNCMTPEELIKEMVDNPAEYASFASFVQEFNGFNKTIDEKIKTAKN